MVSFNRQEILKRILEQPQWDVLVIGGGASGLGIALDAVSRGYKTLLVEQADFAKGTSSRSTKLVHGGVRYLAQGNFKLVREASIERGLLLRNAAHLVKAQAFLVPVYSLWGRIKYGLGLKLYDRIAGKLSMGHSVFVSKKDALEKLPGIKQAGLKGAVLYYDGQFDDARLAVNLAQTIIEKGGQAINYIQVVSLSKDGNGKLNAAGLLDVETGHHFNVNAKAIINATGVFVDDILQMDKPGMAKTICVSQGVHVVMDKSFFSSEHALMIPKTSDGRVLFAVPWHHKVVLGTTDTPVNNAALEPVALHNEIDFILNTAGNYLTKMPTRKDILSVFAGLRPLAAPKGEQQKTKEISRSHKIIVSASKLFTMIGGKWTTYRKMGEDMIDRVEKELHWEHRISKTATLPIHGHISTTDWNNPFYFYGSDAAMLQSQMKEDANNWISEELKIHPQQVNWAAQYEMARTVEDFLSRRTRALLLNAAESKRIAPQVADMMAEALGETEEWKNKQLDAYNKLCEKYLLR